MIKELKGNAKNLTILCVDDEPELLDSLVTFCKKIFGTVLYAKDGQSALDLYNTNSIDIVITDLMMPIMDGIDLISNIRDKNKNISILVLSGHADTNLFMKTIDLGIDGYIIKPMNFDNMIVIFNKICKQIALKIENEAYKNQLEEKVEIEISKRKQSEILLLSQAKHAAMGEMLGMIAHQWRQPLSAITSTANALEIKIKMDRYDKEYFKENIHKISHFTTNLSQTIDDFRNFFKPNNSKEKDSLESIIDRTIEIVENSLEKNDITLSTDYQSNKELEIYANEIQQVVLNLIKNAEDVLKEMNIKNKKISIKTFCDDDIIGLSVSDNGSGIPENIIDNIFDPYFTTKKSKNGTGLGLYMSKTIIEEHCNGNIIVENIKDNGSKFTIQIKRPEGI
jgi:signal transduction histidine kinase